MMQIQNKQEKLMDFNENSKIFLISNLRYGGAYITSADSYKHRYGQPINEEEARKAKEDLNFMSVADTTGLIGICEVHQMLDNRMETSYVLMGEGNIIKHSAFKSECLMMQQGLSVCDLIGTPKQIKWAIAIRDKMLRSMLRNKEDVSFILTKNEAKYFIDWETRKSGNPFSTTESSPVHVKAVTTLPRLVGTPKQIKWAIAIRDKMIKNLTTKEKDTAFIYKQTEAKYFIDWEKTNRVDLSPR